MREKIMLIYAFLRDLNYLKTNIIIHVLEMLHVALIMHITRHSMKCHSAFHMHGNIVSSRACVHGNGYTPFLVNM